MRERRPEIFSQVAPPAKAIVLCVGEKPPIQALERAQGYLMPNGRALTGQSHDCKRHGTTTLFAALEIALGKIIAAHSTSSPRRVSRLHEQRHRGLSGPKLHVILDDLNTHKKKALAQGPPQRAISFHADAFWLNQVEVWFSILLGRALSIVQLHGLSFCP